MGGALSGYPVEWTTSCSTHSWWHHHWCLVLCTSSASRWQGTFKFLHLDWTFKLQFLRPDYCHLSPELSNNWKHDKSESKVSSFFWKWKRKIKMKTGNALYCFLRPKSNKKRVSRIDTMWKIVLKFTPSNLQHWIKSAIPQESVVTQWLLSFFHPQ